MDLNKTNRIVQINGSHVFISVIARGIFEAKVLYVINPSVYTFSANYGIIGTKRKLELLGFDNINYLNK